MNWIFHNNRKGPVAAVLVVLSVLTGMGNAGAAYGSGVNGRLMHGDRPVSGGKVTAYRRPALAGEPVAVSLSSGPDGGYSMVLAPGRYYLAAEGPGGLWSYCGRNPVAVKEGEMPWVGFSMTVWKTPVCSDMPEAGMEGRITGTVLLDGRPAQGVAIVLYLDPDDDFRGMGFMSSVPTADDGAFVMDMVPEGTYYMLARRRAGERAAGPMLKGDLFSYYRYNPLRVEGGMSLDVLLPLVEKRKDEDVHAAGFLGREAGFSGVVADGEGRPVSGIHVLAYHEPEMGHHEPAAVSSATDAAGAYRIFLPEPGIYYVVAREGFGDSPAPGELFGFYRDSPDHAVTLERGRFMSGIDIRVDRVLAR